MAAAVVVMVPLIRESDRWFCVCLMVFVVLFNRVKILSK